MTERDTTPSRLDETWPISGHEEHLITLSDVIAGPKRWFWVIAGCVLATTALAVVSIWLTVPTYVASAQLLIEPPRQQLLSLNGQYVELTIDSAQVASQIAILRSDRIANEVIDHLGLLHDPEFSDGSGQLNYQQRGTALARFGSSLATDRVGESYLIKISFRSTEPEKAARIANAVAEAYIRDQLRSKSETARQASDWLQERVAELGVRLNKTVTEVQRFRTANGIVDSTGKDQPRLIDKLTELEARAQAFRKLYESFLEKLGENEQQVSFPISNARVITPAAIPLFRDSPKTKLVLALAIGLGLIGGAAIATARSVFDGSVRNGRQIRQALRLEPLASLPSFRPPSRASDSGRYEPVLDAPFSSFAEGVREIKISLQHAAENRRTLKIGLLSLLDGEGKTTLSMSLASLFSASGEKTLLIDTDFRKPSLSRRLAPNVSRGLIEVLRGESESAIVFNPKTGSYVLPLVNSERLANSVDLLASPAMATLLSRMEGEFSTIIVDLPSLSRMADAHAVAPMLDYGILVAQCGRTPLDKLKEAVARLRAGRVRLRGAVINRSNESIPPLFGLTWGDLRAFFGGYLGRRVADEVGQHGDPSRAGPKTMPIMPPSRNLTNQGGHVGD